MNKRLVLPVLAAGLTLALAGAGFRLWSTWGSDSAVAATTAGAAAPGGEISDQGRAAHDCDGHAGGEDDQNHHDAMMGDGETAGDDDAAPGAGDGHMQGADHDSMMREHHGNDGNGAPDGGEPDGMMGGGT